MKIDKNSMEIKRGESADTHTVNMQPAIVLLDLMVAIRLASFISIQTHFANESLFFFSSAAVDRSLFGSHRCQMNCGRVENRRDEWGYCERYNHHILWWSMASVRAMFCFFSLANIIHLIALHCTHTPPMAPLKTLCVRVGVFASASQ